MITWDIFSLIIEKILENPFTEISGLLGMIIILIAMFQKDDILVKKLMLLSALFWGTHFYLLGMYSWLASVVIWVARLILSYKYERNFKAFLSIIIATIIIAYFTVNSYISFLPILASITGAYSYFYLQKIKLRLVMMWNSLMYLVYNLYSWSMSGVINEVLVQVVLIMTIYRMMHPEGIRSSYAQRIRQILWKTRRPDYDRFVFIHDRLTNYKKKLWFNFQQILHCDLRKFLPSRKSKTSKTLFD